MPASFHDQEVRSQLKNKRKLSAFLDGLVKKHLRNADPSRLTYIFCTDAFLLEMNQQFLDHDTFTDIITFDLSAGEGPLEGEIYISVDRIKENAAKFSVPYEHELHRVIFHGALHLCGFKDKKKADQEEMRKQEDKCLKAYWAQ